jgi:hypothetical protein
VAKATAEATRTQDMEKGRTMKTYVLERGFRKADFKDRYNADCSIQESSLASEAAIWLGVHENRMHLTVDMVAALIPMLQHFVETGELPAE